MNKHQEPIHGHVYKTIRQALIPVLFLFLAFPSFGQPGNTITFVVTPNCANPTPITLTYTGTDATGRHQYAHSANPTVSCGWNNALSRWEFYHPAIGLGTPFVHSIFASTPNPPDKVTGNYQTGGYFGFDCIGDGSDADFNITGTGTQNFLGGLPISLHSFTAKVNQRNILLQWQTATELNNDYMAIERSIDGRQFQEIGKVNGAGTTDEIQNYSFTDRSPLPGTNYYRLLQVDFDGKTTYHDMITVDYQLEGTPIQLLPNPVTDRLSVQLAEHYEHAVEITLYNLHGQAMLKYDMAPGQKHLELDVSSLNTGHYMLEINSQNDILLQERIVKF